VKQECWGRIGEGRPSGSLVGTQTEFGGIVFGHVEVSGDHNLDRRVVDGGLGRILIKSVEKLHQMKFDIQEIEERQVILWSLAPF